MNTEGKFLKKMFSWGKAVLRIRNIYSRSRIQIFFHPGSRGKNIPDPGSRSRIKELKTIFKLSEK
jgi:hypothetical protein